MPWQSELLDRIRAVVPVGSAVRPYGSVVAPETVDRWSDLDVELTLSEDVEAAALLGAQPWAWQDTDGAGTQRVRVVLVDGRRLDASVGGSRLVLPEPPGDNAVRFDAALAAVRFGRGNELIGLHLALGIVRTALVDVMAAVDRDAGTEHHRSGSTLDRWATEAQAVVEGQLGPTTALRAAGFAERCRVLVDPAYRSDWSGLRAVIDDRGSSDGGA